MIPIVVFWTKYTATVNGRVVKLVPCENCSTEYVYVLEREGTGVGTSVYALNDDAAQGNAASAAQESLREYLANDFDPVPCPICGHYQRYMFPKLYETKSLWAPAARVAVLLLGLLSLIGALYWSIGYWNHPNDHVLTRMVVAWSLLVVFALIGVWLGAIERARARRFDPNDEDRHARIERGRNRAMTRAEFEAAQQQAHSEPLQRETIALDPMGSFGVRFAVNNSERFEALRLLYSEVKRDKDSGEFRNPGEWVRLVPDVVKGQFSWPTTEEREHWLMVRDSTPIAVPAPSQQLGAQWDFYRVFEAIEEGEYDVLGCEMVGAGLAEMRIDPHAYPYGGVGPLIALAEAFGFPVLGVNECGKFEARGELLGE